MNDQLTVVGDHQDVDSVRIRAFLTRNGFPYKDCEFKPGVQPANGVWLRGEFLREPSIAELAIRLGLAEYRPGEVADVAVIGAGPAGQQAGIFAASEGLTAVIVDQLGPGGQAGGSSRIENYMGWPDGISGDALAQRAQAQAVKFGARYVIGHKVVALRSTLPNANWPAPFRLYVKGIEQDHEIDAKSVIIATGAEYRKLTVPGWDRYVRRGVYHTASATEARLCAGKPTVIIGGGNSAGQAAMFLCRLGCHVNMIVRRPLSETMSQYLLKRIRAAPVNVIEGAVVTGLLGTDRALERVEYAYTKSGVVHTVQAEYVFAMLGAEPNTDWVPDAILKDSDGFILTGQEMINLHTRIRSSTPRTYGPFSTSEPGVFAVGDVRANSIKRVASAAGEGAVVIAGIHAYLSNLTGN